MLKLPDPPTNEPFKKLHDYLLEVHVWIGECQKVMQEAVDSVTGQNKDSIGDLNDE